MFSVLIDSLLEELLHHCVSSKVASVLRAFFWRDLRLGDGGAGGGDDDENVFVGSRQTYCCRRPELGECTVTWVRAAVVHFVVFSDMCSLFVAAGTRWSASDSEPCTVFPWKVGQRNDTTMPLCYDNASASEQWTL